MRRIKNLNKRHTIGYKVKRMERPIKMLILPKLIYKFNITPIKISAILFVDIDKMILKFMWKCKGSRIVERTLKQEE